MSSFGLQLFFLCLWIKCHYGFYRTNTKCSFNKKIKCLDDVSYRFCFTTATTSLLYGAIKYCPIYTICSEDEGIKPCIKQEKLIINVTNVSTDHGSINFEQISDVVTFPTTYINDQDINEDKLDVTTNNFIDEVKSTSTPLIFSTEDIYQITTDKIISTTDFPFISPINAVKATEIYHNITKKLISTTNIPIPFTVPNNKNRTYKNDINNDVKQNYKVIPFPKRKKTNTKISNIHNRKRKKKPLLSSISTFLTKLRKKSVNKRKHYSIKTTKKSVKIPNKKPLKKKKPVKILSTIPVNYLKIKKPSKNGILQKVKNRNKNQSSNKLREDSENSITSTTNMTIFNLDSTESTFLTQKLTTIEVIPSTTTAKSITTAATTESTTTTEENTPTPARSTTIKATSKSTTATSTIQATSEIKTTATTIKAISEITTQNATTNLCSILQRLYQSSVQFSTTTTTEATFSTGRPSICDTPGKYPGDKCNEYHECLSVMWWFRWVPRKCERGHSFDPVTSTCVINVFCK